MLKCCKVSVKQLLFNYWRHINWYNSHTKKTLETYQAMKMHTPFDSVKPVAKNLYMKKKIRKQKKGKAWCTSVCCIDKQQTGNHVNVQWVEIGADCLTTQDRGFRIKKQTLKQHFLFKGKWQHHISLMIKTLKKWCTLKRMEGWSSCSEWQHQGRGLCKSLSSK